MKKQLTLLILCLIVCLTSRAQKLMNSTLSGGGVSKMVNGRYFSGVVGQTSVAGSFTNGNLSVRQGFKQPGIQVSFKTQPVASVTNTNKDPENNITFTAYPNPFLDHVTISLSDVIDYPTQIAIYDLTGNAIFEKSFPNLIKDIEIVNLGSLRSGQYILYITQKDKPTTMVLIKQL
ncbi:MAG: hypothetical protein RIS42_29 [Bacteroidota bacterium]|jgi:hypothetical protein